MHRFNRRWLIAAPSICLALLFGRSASASNTLIDGQPQDLWFTYTEPALLTVRTFAVDGSFSDPMLWLYHSDGQLLAANDDWFGLQSFIERQVAPGSYRLRAGFCCGDPNATRQGQRYEVGSSISPVLTTVETSTSLQTSTTVIDTSVVSTTVMQETTSTTTSSVPQTTTTEETTTTIQNVVPTTTVVVPSSTVQPTTSQAPTTTQESTTTSDASTTTLPVSEPIPTSTVLETIPSTTVQDVTTSTVDVTTTVQPTTTLTTMPTRPQATTPPQTSTSIPTTTPITPPATSTSTMPPMTAPPEILETTTTTEAPGEPSPIIPTDPEQISEAVAEAVTQADTPAKRAALTAELNKAPDAAKQIFEQQVNVYSGEWDTYVPAGSRIPVGERRTLIAVMGGLVSLASTAPRRKN